MELNCSKFWFHHHFTYLLSWGKKKIGEKDCYPPSRWSAKCRLSAFDYGEKHLNSWGNSAGISCFTCTPYIHGLALKPKLQSFKVMQYHPP